MSTEHKHLFSRIPPEARRAFCDGDLDLDDILGDTSELSDFTRAKLVGLLEDWGEKNETI